MRYPSPDTRLKVRGPVQELPSGERRQLYIYVSRFGRHTTKVPRTVSKAEVIAE